MRYRIILVALLSSCLLTTGTATAQSAAPTRSTATFEVASIKPTSIRDGSFTINYPPGGRFSARDVSVRILLRNAYNLQEHEIQGGPEWAESAGFDIEAKPAEGAGDLSRQQVQQMLQALLADRFHLMLHRETSQRPMYALVAGKSGLRLAAPGSVTGPDRMTKGHLTVQKMTLASLASILTFDLKRPVKNETGLTGEYAIKLEWAPGLNESDTDPLSRPSLFAAVQEQLGLKLESTTGPVEVLVIDRVQRPDEN